MTDQTIIQGHVLDVLAALPEASVQCVVTSPPYWGLRDYGLPPMVWDEDGQCEHEWGMECGRREQTEQRDSPGGFHNSASRGAQPNVSGKAFCASQGAFCRLCGAWRGQLGLEPTIDLYVQHIVQVFAAVRRVLRDDGCMFVNVGDAYAHQGACGGASPDGPRLGRAEAAKAQRPGTISAGLKPKDLIGQPWRVAFALQADGWYLRSAIVWAKGLSFCKTHSGSVMPESCRDRPTSAYEMVFLMTKKPRYFYDAEAAREDATTSAPTAFRNSARYVDQDQGASNSDHAGDIGERRGHGSTRNLRNVWAINTKPTSIKHFATYPPKLAETCILLGTSEKGCCPCGAPWARVVEKSRRFESGSGRSGNAIAGKQDGVQGGGETLDIRRGPCLDTTTVGWEPTCDHGRYNCQRCGQTGRQAAGLWDGTAYASKAGICTTCHGEGKVGPKIHEPIPCTVLDPFAGIGTTNLAAKRLGRASIGIELSEEYAGIARKRLANQEGSLI